MDTLTLTFGILAAVILFLYGLQGFAREVQAHGQATLQAWFGKVTRHRVPGFLLGALATAVVQSSSVTTGLIIVLVQQGLMGGDVAIAVVIGANLGSTGTALLASLPLQREAHRAALANLLFNVGGLLLWAPFIPWLARAITGAMETPAMAVAMAHVLFNLSTALLFLVLLRPFAAVVDRLLPPRPATSPA